MALKITKQDGNWNATTSWGGISNVPTLHATNVTALGSATVYTDTFTAPSTSETCLGVAVYIGATDTSIVDGFQIQLQEYDYF